MMVEASTRPEPATQRGRETRMRIVAAAADVVYRRGESQTGIRDVKEAAGVSGSQMTHYFPDRDTLIRAVIDYRAREVVDFLDQPEIDGLDSLEKLRRWGELTIAQQRRRGTAGGCVLGSLVAQLSARDETARAALAAGFTAWTDGLEAGIARMRKSGEIARRADPHVLALGVLGALQGGYTIAQATGSIEAMEASLFAAIEHVESFAGPKPRRKSRRS
jgi:TetR/AcrR family transcriptional regulator, transcriptional repressor for nem operon